MKSKNNITAPSGGKKTIDDLLADSDSSSEDDISRKFEKVHAERVRMQKKINYSFDDDDDDDDDNDDDDDINKTKNQNGKKDFKGEENINPNSESDDGNDSDSDLDCKKWLKKPAGLLRNTTTKRKKLTLQERLEERNRKITKRLRVNQGKMIDSDSDYDAADDDDNDSVVELLVVPPTNNQKQTTATEATSRTTRATRNRAAKANTSKKKPSEIVDMISLSSDDDDDDDFFKTKDVHSLSSSKIPIHILKQRGETDDHLEFMQKVRDAKMRLQAAQKYHAEDIDVPEPAIDIPSPSAATTMQRPYYYNCRDATTPTIFKHSSILQSPFLTSPAITGAFTTAESTRTTKNLGSTIGLTIRYDDYNPQQLKSSSTNEVKEAKLSIRQNEQFQVLKERFLQSLDLSSTSASVTFKFDGETLLWTKTPKSHDMEDGDLVDAFLKVIGKNQATRKATSNADDNLGKSIQLKLRTRTVEKTTPFTIAAGRRTTRTSARVTRQSVAATNASANNRPSKIQEDTFSIRMLETFDVLLNKFKEAKNLTNKPTGACVVTFNFDGGKVNLNATPASLDMEDDDLVDVTLQI